MNKAIFTICSANYLPTAKVLLDSLYQHEPDSQRVLVLVEREWPAERLERLGAELHCEVWPLSRLSLPDVERMAFQYDIIEFNTAVKPFVFQALFAQGNAAAIYLDPDICVYRPLSALWEVLRDAPAVVTPHITRPLPDDGRVPSNENMARCGQYNFGFVGFANQTVSLGFIEWWADRLADHCIFHPQHFYFVDQFYGALVSSFVPETRIWFHQGYNFAYWNAVQRSLDGDDETGWTTDDGPLVFFHFSGFTQTDPDALSRYQNRVRAEPGSALSRIAHHYRDAIAANQESMQPFIQAYSFGQYSDGGAIDLLERRAFRDLSPADKDMMPSPFDPAMRNRLGLFHEINDVSASPTGLVWQLWQLRREHENALEALAREDRELQVNLNHSERRLRSVQNSVSYRLGRSMTGPLRWVRDRARLDRPAGRAVRLFERVCAYRARHGTPQTVRAVSRRLYQEWRVQKRLLFGSAGAAVMLRPDRRSQVLVPHTVAVDIIVCVHNAHDDVRRCLESVRSHTAPPYRLILVDDGSEPQTAELLADHARTHGAAHIRNEAAKGYTLAANQGLRASNAPFAVLLNSDTIVTPGWLDRMIRCAQSADDIGIVGPLSNTASWQSVPEIVDAQGDWASNALPEGMSIGDMASLVADVSVCQYPQVAFLNGFCYMIRRELIDAIGIFDEDTFARGYGEENDYSLRAAAAGWRLAVADDAYVYHAQSRSYSSERRKVLAQAAGEALARKHGADRIEEGVALTRAHPVLAALRARLTVAWDDYRKTDFTAQATLGVGRRILFLLPVVQAGGGGNVVIQEAQALIQAGADARIINLAGNRRGFEQNHPHLDVPVHYIDSPDHLDALLDDADAVVATLYVTVEWIAASFARRGEKRVRPCYYMQDFEPYFFSEDDPEFERAWKSYTLLPSLIRITKTPWNRDELLSQCGVSAFVVGCSYNTSLFVPWRAKQSDPVVRVIAMVRPSSPRRGPELTLQVLKALHSALGRRVSISIFGVWPDDPQLASMDTRFPHANLGELPSAHVAAALDEHDVFLDFSTYQAMGLTALEAMACGLAVIAPSKGGASAFIQHDVNALLVDTADPSACEQLALDLVRNRAWRERLSMTALRDAPQHSPERAARRILQAIFDSVGT